MAIAVMDIPKRPALRYYGGKWNLAPWIISFFPPHNNYIELCGGAASVLLRKPRSLLEVYNDLDSNVVNFFKVLRNDPDSLIRLIELTPYAREEYEIAYSPCDDDLERARRFYVACSMSIAATANVNHRANLRSVRFIVSGNHRHSLPELTNRQLDRLYWVADRFLGVEIENDDCLRVIKAYDSPDTLFYFDPPYTSNTRTESGVYILEWPDDLHSEAASLLLRCSGNVVVSGYSSELYTNLYESRGWQRFDKESQTNSGGKRIESLWLSPRTLEALNKPQQSQML